MEGDYERSDYLEGDPGEFMHWLAKLIESQSLTIIPGEHELAIRPPRIVGKNRIEVDVELIGLSENWPKALVFEVEQAGTHTDTFWVESCCFDPHLEYFKLVRYARESLEIEEPQGWPQNCGAPLVTFCETLWAEIYRHWPKLTIGTGDEESPERLPHPRRRERREKVKELWTQGLTDADIAEQLLCGPSTVKRDRKVLGLKAGK